MSTELLMTLGIPMADLVIGIAPGVGQGLGNPLWMLVPWAVFAVAAGVKFWRITTAFRRQLQGTPAGTERFRQHLERIWQKDQQAA
jgi:hypothetical protein